MPDPRDHLTPATEQDVLHDLAFALRHDGKRAFRTADGFMAEITAAHLKAYLDRAGYVLMKKPRAPLHSGPTAFRATTKE